MVRPGVTGLYCLGTIGLPNLAFPLTASGLRYGTFSPFDRLWAALRESFSVSDSLTVETEQSLAFHRLRVTLLVANLVLPSTTEFRVLTPSEVSIFIPYVEYEIVFSNLLKLDVKKLWELRTSEHYFVNY